jgi:uncharacterized protein (DUF433 family)
MNLAKALLNQGNSIEETREIIKEMIEDIINGANPEEVLYDYGLEPDYIFDLLEYAMLG